MKSERFQIELPGELQRAPVDSLSAVFDEPASKPRSSAFLVAHGAGADMDSTFLEVLSQRLVALGFGVMRFNYAYTERAAREGRRRPPDRRAVLEAAHRSALAAFRERCGERRAVLSGKSMGGRIASYLAADGEPCAALCYLGYPLHAPGRKSQPRSEHFPAIVQPSLFLQGTRDNLCDLELLAEALETYGGPTRLATIEGANHSFEVAKKRGGDGGPAYDPLVEAIDGWARDVLPET